MPQPSRNITLPEPWRTFLKEVDEALLQEVSLHCLGGFVLAALYDLPRPTADIDYILGHPHGIDEELLSVAGLGSALSKKHKVFIQRVGVAEVPYEYEQRLEQLELGLKKLKLFVLDPYDIILSKICRDGPKDSHDAKHLIGKLGLRLEEFDRRWAQEMTHIPNRSRHEITFVLWREYFGETV